MRCRLSRPPVRDDQRPAAGGGPGWVPSSARRCSVGYACPDRSRSSCRWQRCRASRCSPRRRSIRRRSWPLCSLVHRWHDDRVRHHDHRVGGAADPPCAPGPRARLSLSPASTPSRRSPIWSSAGSPSPSAPLGRCPSLASSASSPWASPRSCGARTDSSTHSTTWPASRRRPSQQRSLRSRSPERRLRSVIGATGFVTQCRSRYLRRQTGLWTHDRLHLAPAHDPETPMGAARARHRSSSRPCRPRNHRRPCGHGSCRRPDGPRRPTRSLDAADHVARCQPDDPSEPGTACSNSRSCGRRATAPPPTRSGSVVSQLRARPTPRSTPW